MHARWNRRLAGGWVCSDLTGNARVHTSFVCVLERGICILVDGIPEKALHNDVTARACVSAFSHRSAPHIGHRSRVADGERIDRLTSTTMPLSREICFLCSCVVVLVRAAVVFRYISSSPSMISSVKRGGERGVEGRRVGQFIWRYSGSGGGMPSP